MNLPFRLYALSNCPYCHQAMQYLQENKLPADVIVADNDPVIDDGVKARTGKSEYPVLLSRLTQEVIAGWKPEEYARLGKVFTTLVRTGSLDIPSSGLIAGGESQAQATPAT